MARGTVLAVALAGTAVRARTGGRAQKWSVPLRRLHSGHLGDHVACALVGITLFAALLW
ncbi:hypothetical protein [Streptomyces iconiensis]|uniref:Uncharacterized protein n=1 Tax=Streptomyces iconiensis TaxID=1384038 RepID=A0ABT6ZVD0_9ACTN|nr:hypothetical protein [Streptomyces iconiensis]MDJ1133021.1 hypothetical protein [Streptomyces iconiensis]